MSVVSPVSPPPTAVSPPVSPPPTAVSPPAANWYDGASPEIVGHLQNRGLHAKTPVEAALALAQSHREAEGLLGVPRDQLLRMPKDMNDKASWDALYSRLGRPTEATGYDFSAVKFSDGTEVAPDFADFLRQQAFSTGMSKEAAAQLGTAFVKYMEGNEAADAAVRTGALEEQRQSLRQNWGSKFDANMFVAKNAATALGVDPETITALENTIGYSKVMELFRSIGTKIGEDRFVTGTAPAGSGVMTREQAVARKGELMKDRDWANKYLAGDAEKAREMHGLNVIITSGV